MSTIFFTSDHHFGHANIIRFFNRPFADVEEMNEELIRRWNERIGPDDKKDFHFSAVEVLDAEEFLFRHVVEQKL